MSTPNIDLAGRFDHVVVLMFENRSFDNVLGYLYSPTDGNAIDGVVGRKLSNPIPSDFASEGQTEVAVQKASSMDTPDPDPGEEHPHTNTQMFSTVSPSENRFKRVRDMSSPFNAPSDDSAEPTMNGFVADYINTFTAEMGARPKLADFSQILACYDTAAQLPVLNALARGFACFDRWFCEVPSETYCNRSFFHAGSSSGYVLNGPPGKFATGNTAETIFERLQAHGKTWKVYIDPRQLLPATALIHASNLVNFFGDHFSTIFDFYFDAAAGNLPDYSFIEPNMLHPHTDMHPPGFGRLRHELRVRPANSMLGGEQLLANVYNAVRTSPTEGKSNWANTLLLITFDEHGGTYDHVPPPRVPPPSPATGREEEGFKFDRSGVRIPTLAISAWVDPGRVVHEEFRSTSMIRTLIQHWNLGAPLTRRDEAAADIAPILDRSSPRPPNEWPNVHPQAIGEIAKLEEIFELPLSKLERDLVGEALAHEAHINRTQLAADPTQVTRREAHRHLSRIRDNMFPGIAKGRQN
jgi:phospholipase C